jgi:ABC-type uncharacterized transport system substrate-binding protein
MRTVKLNLFTIGLSMVIGVCSQAEAQIKKTLPKIGFICPTGSAAAPSSVFEAFRRGLRDLGYIEGKDIQIEHRFAGGKLDLMPILLNELLAQKVDLVVATNNVLIRAAKAATKTVPIVMISSIDPVAAGYVESFARPGGNITGFAHLGRDLSGKRVELLKDLFPKISRVAILWDADGPGPAVAFKEYESAARGLNLQLKSLVVRGSSADFEEAFRTAKTARAEALIVVGNPLINENRQRIFDLALKSSLPSLTEDSRYVRAGGLISYGANLAELYRSAAIYVDAILKGANPAELRVKQPESFDLFVNLKTAQRLGISLPRDILVRATGAIE